MILTLNYKESAALSMHMALMRKSVRNLIKKRYSKHKNEYLNSFDYVHMEAKKALEVTETGNFYRLHGNIEDLTILTEFLRAYTNKVNDELADNLQVIDIEQIEVLTNLCNRCDLLLEETVNHA